MSHDNSNVVVELVSEEPWLRDPNVEGESGVQPADAVQVLTDEAAYSDDQETQRDSTNTMPSDASSLVEQQSLNVSDESDVDAAELARRDAAEPGAPEPPALVDEAAKLSVGSADESNKTSPSASSIADSVTLSNRSSTSEEEVKAAIDKGPDAPDKLDAKENDKPHASFKADALRSHRSSIGSASVSSGKSRVVPAGAESWSLNRFSDDLLSQILLPLSYSYFRIELDSSRIPFMPGGPLPAGLSRTTSRNSIEWFDFWRWHRWFLSLRLLSKKWNQAVTNSPAWAQLMANFAPGLDTGRTGGALFGETHALLRKICAGCRITNVYFPGQQLVSAQPLSIRQTYILGSVPMCTFHRREKPGSIVSPSAEFLCWNCLQADTEGASVLPNEDYGRFEVRGKVRGNTCRTCREAALEAEIREKWGMDSYRVISGCSPYLAEAYLDEAEGDATEAAKACVRDFWLRANTSYSTIETQMLEAQKQKRIAAAKELRRKVLLDNRDLLKLWAASNGNPEVEDYDDDDDEFDDDELGSEANYKSSWMRNSLEDMDEDVYDGFISSEESIWLERYCIRGWLQSHMNLGVWQSPAEADHKRLPTSNYESISGLPIMPSDPASDSHFGSGKQAAWGNRTPFLVAEHGVVLYQLPPSPLGDLIAQAETLWLDVVEDTLRIPFSNIVLWIKANFPDYDSYARTLDLDTLLKYLRHRPFWQPRKMKLKTKLGAKPVTQAFNVPNLPRSSVDVGHWTAMRIMTVWEEAQAPLRECACSICTRSKRKREEAEQDLLSPEELGDELASNSSELTEFSSGELDEEEAVPYSVSTKATPTGGRVSKAQRR